MKPAITPASKFWACLGFALGTCFLTYVLTPVFALTLVHPVGHAVRVCL